LLAAIGAVAVAVGTESASVAQVRITGRAKITDGDSFAIGTTEIRLFGVDAPEGRQPCTRAGREWACGDAAAAELRRLVGSRDVTCVARDEDDYGRTVAVCRVGSTDLGAALVSAGLALAYRQYSGDYVDEESAARAARRGVWAGEITPPWEWRRTARGSTGTQPARDAGRANDTAPPTRGTAPPNPKCPIKGNINGDDERIYHVPGSPSYDATLIDESRGERWFCSEAEARRAGWRASRN
jgi:endonuclease YncB( thermonuclease family)